MPSIDEIRKPEEQETGIVRPEVEILRVGNTVAAVNPDQGLSQPNLPEGYVDRGGIIVPNKQETQPQVLRPEREDIGRYSLPKEPQNENYQQDLVLFTAMPWTFFDKKLTENGVRSPVGEIKEVIQSDAGKLDTSDLQYNEWDKVKSHSGDIPQGFYETMEESLSILSGETIRDPQFVDRFFKHMNPIVETQIYSNRCYKLRDPRVVEKILEKFTESNVKIPSSVCDFISYFDIPPSFTNDIDIVLDRDSSHPLRYMIDARREERSARRDGKEKEYENIGIEIEGFPKISIGEISHPGFSMGIDGGCEMPELRRRDDKIRFDESFKQDIFELWYWAKISRLIGVSLHIHIDDEEGSEVLSRFSRIFGGDWHDLRNNSGGKFNPTVEIRLNLPFYPDEKNQKVEGHSEFNPDIYNIGPLIEEIEKIKNAKGVKSFDGIHVLENSDGQEHILGQNLCSWWRARFMKNKEPANLAGGSVIAKGTISEFEDPPFTVESARELIREEGVTTDVVLKIFSSGLVDESRKAKEDFVKEYINELAEGFLFLGVVFEGMGSDLLTPEFARELINECSLKHRVVREVLLNTDSVWLTPEYINELIDLSGNDVEVIGAVFSSAGMSFLTQDFVKSLFDRVEGSRKKFVLIRDMLENVEPDFLQKDFIKYLLEVSGDEEHIVELIIKHVDTELLTEEFARELIEYRGNHDDLVVSIIDHIDSDLLTRDLAVYLIEKSGFYLSYASQLIAERIRPDLLSEDFARYLIETSGNMSRVVVAVAENIKPENITVDFAYYMMEVSDYDVYVLRSLFDNLNTNFLKDLLTPEFTRHLLLDRCRRRLHVAAEVIKYMDVNLLTEDFMRDLIDIFSYSSTPLINELFSRANVNSFSKDFLLNLLGILETDFTGSYGREKIFSQLNADRLTVGFLRDLFSSDWMFSMSYRAIYSTEIIKSIKKELLTQEISRYLLEVSDGDLGTTVAIVENINPDLLTADFLSGLVKLHDYAHDKLLVAATIIEHINPELLTENLVKEFLEQMPLGNGSALSWTVLDRMNSTLLTESFAKYLLIISGKDDAVVRKIVDIINPSLLRGDLLDFLRELSQEMLLSLESPEATWSEATWMGTARAQEVLLSDSLLWRRNVK